MFPEVNTILEYFLKNPTTTIHLRELARKTNFSSAGCSKSLKSLLKKGVIECHKTKAVSNYKATLNSKFLQLKKIYNIYSLYDSGLIDFLKEKYQFPETIIIFGSYSKGEDTEKSDIDIAVITRLEKNLDFSLFEKKLQRKINLLELKNLEKAKKEFINNLINGIVLDGVIQI